MRARAIRTIVACVVFASAGCASDLESGAVRAPDSAVREPASAPARLALEWWRALQAREPAQVVGLLTPTAREPVDLERAAARIKGSFGRWAEGTLVDVLYSERTADGMTVYMRVEAGEPLGSLLSRRGTVMLALPFVLRRENWRIDDSAWLRLQVELFTAADRLRRAQRAGAGEP